MKAWKGNYMKGIHINKSTLVSRTFIHQYLLKIVHLLFSRRVYERNINKKIENCSVARWTALCPVVLSIAWISPHRLWLILWEQTVLPMFYAYTLHVSSGLDFKLFWSSTDMKKEEMISGSQTLLENSIRNADLASSMLCYIQPKFLTEKSNLVPLFFLSVSVAM